MTAHIPRPRTITGILDLPFDVMRRHTRVLAVLAVVIVMPLAVTVLVLEIRSVGLDAAGDPFAGFSDDEGSSIGGWLAVMAMGLSSLQVTLMAAAVTPLVFEDTDGRPTASGLLLRALPKLPVVLLGWVIVKVIEVAGLLGVVVGSAVLMVFCSLVTPAIVMSTTNPFRAVGESFRLVSAGFGRAVAVISLMIVVDNGLHLSFVAVPSVITAWTGWTLGAAAVGLLSVVAALLSASFVALATAALYVDLRVRSEHLDLERRFEALGVTS